MDQLHQLHQSAVTALTSFQEQEEFRRQVNMEHQRQLARQERREKREARQAAMEYFFNMLTNLDHENKVQRASSHGKTQTLLYRVNYRYHNYHNWKNYVYRDVRLFDLLNEQRYSLSVETENGIYNEDQLVPEPSELVERLEKFFAPFKVKVLYTSWQNTCIFIYWRKYWDDSEVLVKDEPLGFGESGDQSVPTSSTPKIPAPPGIHGIDSNLGFDPVIPTREQENKVQQLLNQAAQILNPPLFPPPPPELCKVVVNNDLMTPSTFEVLAAEEDIVASVASVANVAELPELPVVGESPELPETPESPVIV